MFELISISKVDPAKHQLKEAAAVKKSGDLIGAIDALKEAYREISKTPTDHGIDTFFRLPYYMQSAGQTDEAWKELNRLLVEGYPNQDRTPEFLAMDHALIYDKMRIFLQRENRNAEAIKFGIFSHFLWAIGLEKQGRKQELRTQLSKKLIKSLLDELLGKSNKDEHHAELLTLMTQYLKGFPTINFPLLGNDINAITLRQLA